MSSRPSQIEGTLGITTGNCTGNGRMARKDSKASSSARAPNAGRLASSKTGSNAPDAFGHATPNICASVGQQARVSGFMFRHIQGCAGSAKTVAVRTGGGKGLYARFAARKPPRATGLSSGRGWRRLAHGLARVVVKFSRSRKAREAGLGRNARPVIGQSPAHINGDATQH